MKLDIRRADLAQDRQVMIQAVAKYLNPNADTDRFDWLYLKNPHGIGLAWIATDAETQSFVGMASAFPRRYYFEDQLFGGWVLGEFCIHENYRSLGPALQFQRQIIEELKAEEMSLFYDFPSTSMEAVYRRLSIPVSHRMLRLAYPLRIDRKLPAVLNWPGLRNVVSGVGNAILRLPVRSGGIPEHVSISFHQGPCQMEFSELANNIRGRYGCAVQRSAEYLNWRYFDSPHSRCQMLVARIKGQLTAFAVFRRDQEHGLLLDLFGHDQPEVLAELVKAAARSLVLDGASTMSVPMLQGHPMIPVFHRLGFSQRGDSPVVIWKNEGYRETMLEEAHRWCLMHGDRDS